MTYVYMGFLDWAIQPLLNLLLTPVRWILENVLGWLFNNALRPVLETVFTYATGIIWTAVRSILSGFLFYIMVGILKIVDVIESSFDYISGLKKVTYHAAQMSLTDALFSMQGLSRAFWVINAMGLTVAFILTIYSVTKSAIDLDFDNKRPVSRVMSSFFKCVIQLFTVQFVVYFVVKLAGVMLEGINTAILQMNSNVSSTIARTIFVVSSMNAAQNKAYNISEAGHIAGIGPMDSIRSQYYSVNGKNYVDIDVVKADFDIANMDYILGILLAVAMLILLAACAVVFIQRIFDMLMLYIISPLFVATIPADDGERFGKWRELFIGKCFSGFGMIMLMKLFLMMTPTIMSSDLTIIQGSPEMDYLAKILFLVGGAWAVLKSGSLITSLLSASAGSQEQATANTAAAYAESGVSYVGGIAGSYAWSGTKFLGKQAWRGTKFVAGSTLTGIGKGAAWARDKLDSVRYGSGNKHQPISSDHMPGAGRTGSGKSGSSLFGRSSGSSGSGSKRGGSKDNRMIEMQDLSTRTGTGSGSSGLGGTAKAGAGIGRGSVTEMQDLSGKKEGKNALSDAKRGMGNHSLLGGNSLSGKLGSSASGSQKFDAGNENTGTSGAGTTANGFDYHAAANGQTGSALQMFSDGNGTVKLANSGVEVEWDKNGMMKLQIGNTGNGIGGIGNSTEVQINPGVLSRLGVSGGGLSGSYSGGTASAGGSTGSTYSGGSRSGSPYSINSMSLSINNNGAGGNSTAFSTQNMNAYFSNYSIGGKSLSFSGRQQSSFSTGNTASVDRQSSISFTSATNAQGLTQSSMSITPGTAASNPSPASTAGTSAGNEQADYKKSDTDPLSNTPVKQYKPKSDKKQ